MQDYNTIIGVITLRQNGSPFSVIQARYHIGSGTAQRILDRFGNIDLSLDKLKAMEPRQVEELIYPRANLRRKNAAIPDYQTYYDRIHAKESNVSIARCWLEYKSENPDGYKQSQFYEYYKRFVEEKFGKNDDQIIADVVPGEKMHIYWIDDQDVLLTDKETGEAKKVQIFVATLGLSGLIYAEAFIEKRTTQFVSGTVNAIRFYGGIAKYIVQDNIKSAVSKRTEDGLTLSSAYADLEEYYDTIILPLTSRKQKDKTAVENRVEYLKSNVVVKLRGRIYASLEEINDEIQKIISVFNNRKFQEKGTSRKEMFNKYDRTCLKVLPDEPFPIYDYKIVTEIPHSNHIEYDGCFYYVGQSYCRKRLILKTLKSEIFICDQYNRLICKHEIQTYNTGACALDQDKNHSDDMEKETT